MFSYSDYRKILEIIKETGLACDYEQALDRDSWIIMRHDVEYSVDRAFALSKVEESMDFHSTWFFQWTNNSYNILSRKNRDILTEMKERGHNIGLHFALNGMTDMNLIQNRIIQESQMLSNMLGFEIKWFSVHRPSREILAANLHIPGLLNAYQNEFFTFDPAAGENSHLEVKYMSDANHIWRYGYPDQDNLKGNKKIQILTHPFAWSKPGYDNLNNYKALILEKYEEMLDSIDNECKDFGPIRDEFEDVIQYRE